MRWVLLFLFLAACSKGPEADLPYISQARSLVAEWALVNEQARQDKLTPTYVETMRKSIRQQLQTNSRSLSEPDSAYGHEIASVLREPDDASAEQLRAHCARLKQIEDSFESA